MLKPLSLALVSSLLLLTNGVNAQTMNASMCKVLTNKAERQKCMMRYGAENVKKENSNKAREEQYIKSRKEHFSAQKKALKPFDAPKITEQVPMIVYFKVGNIPRAKYIDCQAINSKGDEIAKNRFHVKPKTAYLQMEIPLNEYAKQIKCK